MVAWQVPVTTDYPQGLRFSFVYMDADGDTLLRFDNSPYHLDVGRHHRHTPDGDIEPVEYTDLPDHVDRSHNEVNALYEQRTD